MKYNRVHLEAIGYELPPVVVSTAELESRLAPVYQALKMSPGQLELLTGINERRWWEPGYPLSRGAAAAAKKALAAADMSASEIDVLIYAGVCRENFEPATACAVAHELKINPNAAIFDLSNACLGVLNGIVEIANKIELGQAEAGLVVSAETAREINENVIDRMVRTKSVELFRESIATLTGGSGAVAVLVVSAEMSREKRRKLLGGVTQNAPQHHSLCRWGLQSVLPAAVGTVERVLGHNAAGLVQKGVDNANALVQRGLDLGLRHVMIPFMETHAGEVLKYGVELGNRTWQKFLAKFGWRSDYLDKVICHQVGAGHREAVLKGIGIPPEKDFSTFEYLGNIGTVSLPITAAIAEEREFLRPGDRVGFLGIGSGLNCLMLGLEW
ncbi:3-oxoacyl-acp synthase : 3-Oxoacyl-(Acyl-carrier-protein (ACP)) synthase III domain protein OS=Planctomyces limnophilus (strain ATCC 43296 / DSM 3776 / IFAM 1008 / 290) GN=Plim_3323 PE=4 SV=1: ACP_syn_III: ACP_syn_III_C [Gemmata massiliana]|uniref:Beta-ketoacyl-[acyl-carrier-protein] synthase III C-terminal domain-containing protein n=1 Tax=Gemmata massiliana TaxID=1210884 RepID=A0A6P2DEG8_9BACT|nr:3-oxoacyl-ACP synthase III [Gemmata massiliana]VTR99520.1 3-oxoacyl-acp synthase : 3-Oxoacyl-(Acyl-carrier-protein (ACP)) synthase III domain protein OS=Planctomyces limnophilus (strain ATCC 43296 / DSM 3776 / IFAM 1008 / 290) GN=Plim_3323 PE=4 SV=1: ACP_syn_III: ACP_syn_III_C [Gemmata massiliana]